MSTAPWENPEDEPSEPSPVSLPAAEDVGSDRTEPDRTEPYRTEPYRTEPEAERIDWGNFAKGQAATGLSPTPEPPAFEKPKKRPLALVGALVGVAALAGGGLIAYKAFSSDPVHNTPQQAVTAFYTALENRDAIGFAETLAPGERDALLDTVVPMVDELKRLEILDSGLDLHKISGFDVSFKNLKLESALLRDDLAAVTISGGSVTSNADVSKLPLGKFVRELAGQSLSKQIPTSSTDSLGSDTKIVTVREGKTWYVSANYSIAYGSTKEVPEKGSGVPALGATSPQAAVSDLLIAASTLDVRRVVQLMAPDELPALHEYAGMFVPKAEDQVRDLRKQYTVSLPGLEFSTEGSGSTRTVKITKVGARVDFATSDGEPVSASVDGRCVTVSINGEKKKRCGADVLKLVEDFGGPAIDTKSLTDARKTSSGAYLKKPNVGFVVVERDGQWFISPTRTMVGAMTQTLKTVSRADLDRIVAAAKKAATEIRGVTTASSVQHAVS